MNKNNAKNLLLYLGSELICFSIIALNLIPYDRQKIYLTALTIVQAFYFIPILLVSFPAFLSQKPEKKLLISTTFFLIFYSIILHFFIKPLAMFFTSTPGILNFVEYSGKIYFITLPLLSFEILGIKNETVQKHYLLLIFRIFLLLFLTLLLKYKFQLKGILYSLGLCHLVEIFLLFIKNKNSTPS